MPHRTKKQKQERKQVDKQNNAEWKLYRSKNPDETAQCNACGDNKPLKKFPSSFSIRKTCLECLAKRQKQWRTNHPIVARKISAKLSATARSHIREAKNIPCKLCGKKWPPCVMDFHHVSGKKVSDVSKMTGSSVNRIKSETQKCELVCANCHRDLTFQERGKIPVRKNRAVGKKICDISTQLGDEVKKCALCGNKKSTKNFTLLKTGYLHSYCKKCLRERNRQYGKNRTGMRSGKAHVVAYKDNKPCSDCGNLFRYWMLDLDHVRGKKTANVNQIHMLALHRIKEELEKCDIVCVNCHRIRTHRRRTLQTKTANVKVDVNRVRLIVLNIWDVAKKALETHHYAGYGRAASNMFAAMHGEEMAAVVKFAPVVRKEVALKEGVSHGETLELDRFCILPPFRVPNMASKIMSLAVSAVKKERPDVKLLVSFADPAQGHDGAMYRASNWKFVSTGAPSYVYESSDGHRINKKTLYDAAKRRGMIEKEYAALQCLSKIVIPGKHKFVYWLK